MFPIDGIFHLCFQSRRRKTGAQAQNETPYTKALADYLDGRKVVDFVNLDERFDAISGSPVADRAVDGAVDGMSDLEDGLAKARCTPAEFEAKTAFLIKRVPCSTM